MVDPGRLFERFGSNFGLIFEGFRRGWSTRFDRGRTLFRVARATRNRVQGLRAQAENQPKIAPNRLAERAVRSILDFFAPGGDSASILVVSRRLQALPGTLFASPGWPWGAFGRSRGGARASPGRPRIARQASSSDQVDPRVTSSDKSRPRRAPKRRREPIRDDFRTIWG